MDAAIVVALNHVASRSRASRLWTRLVATYLPVLMVVVFFVFCLANFSFHSGIIWFIEALIAAIIARLVGTVIRLFIKRPRPFRILHLSPLIHHRSLSFPSGHALFFSAFSVIVLAASVPLGMVMLGATLVVCVARVACGIHYPSDMLLGIFIGIIIGSAILHFFPG